MLQDAVIALAFKRSENMQKRIVIEVDVETEVQLNQIFNATVKAVQTGMVGQKVKILHQKVEDVKA